MTQEKLRAPTGSEQMSICMSLLALGAFTVPIMLWGHQTSSASVPSLKGDLPAIQERARPAKGGEADESPSVVIERIRHAYGLPKGLLEGLIQHESKWDEQAYVREPKLCRQHGFWREPQCYAHGLTQVVLGYHATRCKADSRGLRTWRKNILCGGTLLGENFRKAHGNVRLALGYFNGDRSGKYAAKVIIAARKFGYRG